MVRVALVMQPGTAGRLVRGLRSVKHPATRMTPRRQPDVWHCEAPERGGSPAHDYRQKF
jgi:hypothetical protein